MDTEKSATAIDRAISAAGSAAELARRLEISHQLVCMWRKRGSIPPGRVLAIEAATGIPRHELRPDFYPPDAKAA